MEKKKRMKAKRWLIGSWAGLQPDTLISPERLLAPFSSKITYCSTGTGLAKDQNCRIVFCSRIVWINFDTLPCFWNWFNASAPKVLVWQVDIFFNVICAMELVWTCHKNARWPLYIVVLLHQLKLGLQRKKLEPCDNSENWGTLWQNTPYTKQDQASQQADKRELHLSSSCYIWR